MKISLINWNLKNFEVWLFLPLFLSPPKIFLYLPFSLIHTPIQKFPLIITLLFPLQHTPTISPLPFSTSSIFHLSTNQESLSMHSHSSHFVWYISLSQKSLALRICVISRIFSNHIFGWFMHIGCEIWSDSFNRNPTSRLLKMIPLLSNCEIKLKEFKITNP